MYNCKFRFCGKAMACAKTVVHLSHALSSNLLDDDDILQCSREFIKQANSTCFD